MLGTSTRGFALVCAGWMMLGCAEPDNGPIAPTGQRPADAATPSAQADNHSQRTSYEVRLDPKPGTNARGTVRIGIVGGNLTVSVHATGLAPQRDTPQHIHAAQTCQEGGPVLINLDANLTVFGEAPSVGPDFPTSNPAGIVNYHASRPLSDLLQAVNTHFGMALTSVDELLGWLDLASRNVHMHAPDAPFTPVNCGEVNLSH